MTRHVVTVAVLIHLASAGPAQQLVLSTDDFDRTGSCILVNSYTGGCNWAQVRWFSFVGPTMRICATNSFAPPSGSKGYVTTGTATGLPAGSGPIVRNLPAATAGEQWFSFLGGRVFSFGGAGPCRNQTGWNVAMNSGGNALINVVDPSNCPTLKTVGTAKVRATSTFLVVGRLDTSATSKSSIRVWINPKDLTKGVAGLGSPTLEYKSALPFRTWDRVVFSQPLDSIRVAQGAVSADDKLSSVAVGRSGQGNSPAATLRINGIGTGLCPGPFYAQVVAPGTLTLDWSGPASRPYALGFGPRQPRFVRFGCSGSLDVRPLAVLFDGTQLPLFSLGTGGTARLTFTVPKLPPGELVNLQGLVTQPATAPCPSFVLTAAFYVSVR